MRISHRQWPYLLIKLIVFSYDLAQNKYDNDSEPSFSLRLPRAVSISHFFCTFGEGEFRPQHLVVISPASYSMYDRGIDDIHLISTP